MNRLTVDIVAVVKTAKRKRDQSSQVLDEQVGPTGKRLRLAESRWVASGEEIPLSSESS